MEFERASLEIDGGVAILHMNDPKVLNAVSADMLKGMTDALDALAASETKPRCLVFTGTGRAFSTGANLQGRSGDVLMRGAGHTLETVFHPFIRRLRDLPFPIITAVNGVAAGAGMSLALWAISSSAPAPPTSSRRSRGSGWCPTAVRPGYCRG